jgi:hypothetical protein
MRNDARPVGEDSRHLRLAATPSRLHDIRQSRGSAGVARRLYPSEDGSREGSESYEGGRADSR